MQRHHELRINARELLRQPGVQRSITTTVAPSALDIEGDHYDGDISVDLTATSTTDSIVVHGSIDVPWQTDCRRCLTPLHGVEHVTFDEVYAHEPLDDDVFPIVGDQIDLAAALRDHVVLDVPEHRECRPDCAGICPVCGVDRNQTDCNCDTTVRDDRWAALDGLELD